MPIEVRVNDWGGGRTILVWTDPITGRDKSKSPKAARKLLAELGDHPPEPDPKKGYTKKQIGQLATLLQERLRKDEYREPSAVTWQDFRERFRRDKYPELAPASQAAYETALNLVEETMNPDRLAKVTTPFVTEMKARLRKEREVKRGEKTITKPPMKESTLTTHLRHLHGALSWASSAGLLHKLPKVEMPKKSKGQPMMRGRPITVEEFERMLAVVPKVRPKDPEIWTCYLTGLWLSGLRLRESLALSWDDDATFAVCLTGRRPAFRIYAEAQKARRDELLPMTPDFAEWLLATPEEERHGPVFKLPRLDNGLPLTAARVGRIVAKIGRKAKVVVNKAEGKYASAHDLRRAFGTRWATKEMPAVLQRLMRHASIDTTMSYYVALNADDLADALWAKFSAPTNRQEARNAHTFAHSSPPATVNAEGAPDAATSETSSVETV